MGALRRSVSMEVLAVRSERQQLLRHFQLAAPGLAGELFDFVQGQVLRLAGFGGMHRRFGQGLHHRTDGLHQAAPVGLVDAAQRGDRVADALQVADGFVLLAGECLGRCRQPGAQPGAQLATEAGGQLFQAMVQLQPEGLQHAAFAHAGFEVGDGGQAGLGGIAVVPVVDDIARGLQRRKAFRQAAQVLDQHHPQGGGQRPEFGQGERALFLIGLEVAGQQLDVEAAVGMRHPRPGDAIDAGQAGQRLVTQTR